jgi:DNA-binding NarL/FixJ family response regulator
MNTVVLVDDYPEMRQLLRDILERYPDMQIVGEAASGEEAVTQCSKTKPTVVIIAEAAPSSANSSVEVQGFPPQCFLLDDFLRKLRQVKAWSFPSLTRVANCPVVGTTCLSAVV